MNIYTSYSVKIKHYNRIFADTVRLYRAASDFFIKVMMNDWDSFRGLRQQEAVNLAESLTVVTAKNPAPAYDFGKKFYKFPCYLRRAAIAEAYGAVCSYQSRMALWAASGKRGRGPGRPNAGHAFPVMYRDNCFVRTGTYSARIKVWIRNTWDWLDVELNRGDADYILRRCAGRKECVPVLRKRGHEWFLSFSFMEKTELCDVNVSGTTVIAVDLGINNACTCSAMRPDGTVIGREFLSLSAEKDSLDHAAGRIRKAQRHGARHMPRLWAKAGGINDRIAVLTAQRIIDVASKYNADVIVFEHLDVRGKKHGGKKQKLHMWRCRYVQAMVTDKAHRMKMHVSHVCAWGTSAYAYDGSGRVERGVGGNYSICRFPTGKIYNCDLSASYNIGARWFIREIMKSLPATAGLAVQAKVPELARRSTCTLSSLINLNAALAAYAA